MNTQRSASRVKDPFGEPLEPPDPEAVQVAVQAALREDLGPGDLAASLVPADQKARGELHLRKPAVVCGQAWFNACFRALAPGARVEWRVAEGEHVAAPGVVAEVSGPVRAILSAERSALNLLQTLSGTATETARLVALLAGARSRLLDTRKTLPGLRVAQKYAVRCGGGYNHRLGLWDAVLIKENHILACGSIHIAVERARTLGKGRWIEVETENLDEVDQALDAGADVVMLDDFTLEDLREAVGRIRGRAVSEASGNVTDDSLPEIAATGVDYISVGGLTKNLRAIDFSLRLV
ncbi:Quinolinate phosphoribosyltransferase (decarboxylating) [Thioalkalivibrio nitratireducens DSM 14787]|uniref:nicotinate-nucleotide diphosphorylase (carboxylating) n=1 Tax=Thioalkalivibrio nitratireducens (strain DSM 14787 / UNIQEM 213 / ALEN2) TaxID=1255043 RepID=L0DYA2_THIND|nr:carboxylating nicotinate-nucleotide diphosphorylase [Thioalkalivibrio nitratireducens]AGA33982.1 Quinolinate phosphoribosyltransferase (decarboxylating) [Thioalkalivibrio nitratireducens DSM 14787]